MGGLKEQSVLIFHKVARVLYGKNNFVKGVGIPNFPFDLHAVSGSSTSVFCG